MSSSWLFAFERQGERNKSKKAERFYIPSMTFCLKS
jgi:hypothetical protein